MSNPSEERKYNILQEKFNKMVVNCDRLTVYNKELKSRIDNNTEETIEELNFTIENLEEQLNEYKSLSNKGNVYSTEKDDTLVTYREMVVEELMKTMSTIEIAKLLDFSLKDTSNGGQYRTFAQKLRYSQYLTMSKTLATAHVKEYGRCSDRYKGTVTTPEMVKGKNGFHNQYPPHYIKHIEDYIKIHPTNTWEDFPKYIEKTESDEYLYCTKCDTRFKFKTMKPHLLTKKHKDS